MQCSDYWGRTLWPVRGRVSQGCRSELSDFWQRDAHLDHANAPGHAPEVGGHGIFALRPGFGIYSRALLPGEGLALRRPRIAGPDRNVYRLWAGVPESLCPGAGRQEGRLAQAVGQGLRTG